QITADFIGHVNSWGRGFRGRSLCRLLLGSFGGVVATRRNDCQTKGKKNISELAHVYFSLKVKLASALPWGATVSWRSCVPSVSVQTATVYVPGGRFFISKVPSSFETAK